MTRYLALFFFLLASTLHADQLLFQWRNGTGGSWGTKNVSTTPNSVLAADANGEPVFIPAPSGVPAVPSMRIPYGNPSGVMTTEAGFEYDPTYNNLKIPTMLSLGSTGSAFAMYPNGSGILSMFNDFTDETL